jgi:hypothetical protein
MFGSDRLTDVAVYEVTMVFPDVSYEANRRFLASVVAATRSPLQGFRQVGEGVALTFVITTGAGIDFAMRVATQRAAGLWPNARSATMTVRIGSPSASPPA